MKQKTPQPQKARTEKRATALRANLLKRKAQTRARDSKEKK